MKSCSSLEKTTLFSELNHFLSSVSSSISETLFIALFKISGSTSKSLLTPIYNLVSKFLIFTLVNIFNELKYDLFI